VAHGHEKHAGAARSIAKIFNRFNPKRQRFASIERALLAGNDRPFVVCLSEYIRREVRTYYTLDEADLVTLFNAVDLARFDPKARPDERADMRKQLSLKPTHVAALMIAQDFERKGLREAILALAKVQNRPLQLMVVGKQDATRYIDLAREVGVADRMIFCGPMDDVYAYYSAADFFVLPTKHDPCSLVVLEALAMGLPVISTKQNGATEVMENGVDGFILEDASRVDELADAMSRLCDSKLRTQMSAACLERRERLSFERHLEQLMRIYQSASERRLLK
jgi:UDP-glucose:(heptosyl)LPS alpha-1,3-glucosyltransferase